MDSKGRKADGPGAPGSYLEEIMEKVITYRLAYLDRTVDLCRAHAASYDAPLGPVEHGLHRGECAVCSAAGCPGGDDCQHQTYHEEARR